MTNVRRIAICGIIIMTGLAAQAALERGMQTVRPPLLRPLSTLPMELGDWVGVERTVSEDIIDRSQATEFLSRTYESRRWPGLKLSLWINYAERGANLRHTPKVCLPSGGWTEVESQTRVLEVPDGAGHPIKLTRLGYSQGVLVLHVGFWYYIFGEGRLENYVRRLPITSESSHGRATRGSSMTVEVFYPGDGDPNGEALRDFAGELARGLEPCLPSPRAAYFMP